MRTLYLLRHAKSSWKDESIPDFDRPLKKRGREAAEGVGKTLAGERLSSPILISSSALRTRETTEIVLKAGNLKANVSYDERIYEADLPRLLRVLADVAANEKELILVGHNPGMEYLVEFLTGVEQRMPTAALAKISLEVESWGAIGRGEGRLEWLITPDDLKD
jgi:phosphohistidine phosphatase